MSDEIQMDSVQSGDNKSGSDSKAEVKSETGIFSIIESNFNAKDSFKEYKYEILLGIIILGTILFAMRNKINYLFNSYNPVKETRMNPKIPRVIYQCYKDKNVPPIVKGRWLKLNPDFEYHLYDNEDCYQFLLDHYGARHAKLFKFIKDGPIKSDFWRVCILYKYGGVYADIDIIPEVPIDEIVYSDTTLYTCISDPNLHLLLNPHFIAVEPNNPLILECINIYMKDKIHRKYNYHMFSITHIMLLAFQKYFNIFKFEENIYKKDDQIVQLSQEICPDRHNIKTCYIRQNNKSIMKNRDSELYDEHNHRFK